MSKQRNLNDGDLPKILSRLERLERQASLAHSAIGREGLEVYDGGWIRILNGGLQVIGTATISGTLDVTGVTNLKGQTSVTGPMEISGTTNITGNTNIMGELVVTGPTTLDGLTEIGGDTTITGLLDIKGNTTVDGDFEIIGNGLFKAGETKIEPNGKATFGDFVIDPNSNKLIDSPAGWLFSSGPDSIGLSSSNTSSVNLNATFAELNYGGSSASIVRASNGRIDLNAAKTWINGEVEVSGRARLNSIFLHLSTNLPTVTYPPNLYVHSDGRVFRSTWTPPT